MTTLLLTAQEPPLPVDDETDPRVGATVGPAVLFACATASGDNRVASTEYPRPHDAKPALANRPVAYREAGADWHELGYEAADHWENLSSELRERLIADRTAQVSVAEYSATTDGASASMITNNWVHSGSPRMYRIAGELRELAEVVAELS
ncbi:hypothetical protein [Brevibacterium sp. ZH18]|uniref:hypothetical protein n=1 Tax=Brevibacterium sp. ZH18 TaxID=2927784 RepID=UPI001F601DB3|nr:hypothetical protein [Brevibacterium sp. ZH18]MCI4011425.1 hypothetical protein [Brevibacterium sp. ZH18]